MRRVGLIGLALWVVGSLAGADDAPQAGPPHLSRLAHVLVREFRFEGNTVFSDAELARVVAPYTGREVSSEELQEARRAVTQHYIERGYINSGAIIPEQPLRDNVVTIRIIEGRLTETSVTGQRWLRDRYYLSRLRLRTSPPLNVNELRDGLQVLRQNPNVQQINAELQPGALPGEARLAVRVVDRHPFRLGVQVDNARPPSVGAEEILLLAGDRNLTGRGDALHLSYGIAHNGDDGFEFTGLDNVSGVYALPITARDTTLTLFGSKSDFAIEEALSTNHVNIASESYRAGIGLRQPLYRTANREFALALTTERRESETFFNDVPTTLTPGAVNGKMEVTVLRLAQEWVDRGQNHVLAVRSTFSFGVDVLDTTDDGSDRDAKFWVWLGQFQYVRRVFQTPAQLILRTDVQWTDEPLPALEQFSLGGSGNIRGYRENQLVRDRGVYSGVELRVPVLVNKLGAPIVQLAPFFDFGGGWNINADTPHPTTISSAGIGVLLTPNKHISAQLYWGHAFRDLDMGRDNLQDSGIHFQVNCEAF